MSDVALASMYAAAIGAAAVALRARLERKPLTTGLFALAWALAALLRASFTADGQLLGLLLIDLVAFVLLVGVAWSVDDDWIAPAITVQAFAALAALAGVTDAQLAPQVSLVVSHGSAVAAAVLLALGSLRPSSSLAPRQAR